MAFHARLRELQDGLRHIELDDAARRRNPRRDILHRLPQGLRRQGAEDLVEHGRRLGGIDGPDDRHHQDILGQQPPMLRRDLVPCRGFYALHRAARPVPVGMAGKDLAKKGARSHGVWIVRLMAQLRQ